MKIIWYDHMNGYQAIFHTIREYKGTDITIQDDYMDRIDRAIEMVDERSRDKDIFRQFFGLRPYENNMSFQDLGDMYDVIRDRIRQIVQRILMDLHYPEYYAVIAYGMTQQELYDQRIEKHKISSSYDKRS